MNTVIGGRFVIPEMVVSHFHLKEGDTVADYGAGSGFFLKTLSRAVGETGKVYACEIQKQLVEKIGDLARLQGLQNVYPLWCDLEEIQGIKVPSAELDAAVVVNALFMIEDKDTSIKEMARTIRTGGRLFLIDWSESFSGMGPQPAQVIEKAAAISLLESNNFVLEIEFPAGDHHYGLAFRKI